MLYNKNKVEIEEDAAFLRNYQYETCAFYRGDYPNREYAFAIQLPQPILELGNIWMGGTGEQKKYDSLEQLLEDGWIID